LLAFDPVGGFVDDSMKFSDAGLEEIAGVAFFPSGGCFPRATDCEVEVFESAGGLALPDGRGDGSVADVFSGAVVGFFFVSSIVDSFHGFQLPATYHGIASFGLHSS